jgi:hypothetical protein
VNQSSLNRTSVVLASIVAIAVVSASVAASNRSSGDSWTYGVGFTVEGVKVNGTLTYAYVGDGPLEVNGTPLDAHVMKVSGVFSGSELDASVNVSVTGLIDGYRYESSDGHGILGEEVLLLVNVSTGYEGFWVASSMEIGSIVMYSAPLLSTFDPDNPEVVVAWNQSVEVFEVESCDGESSSYEKESSSLMTFNITAERLDEPLETEAGAFDTHRITISGDSGMTIMWYSEEVGNFVRTEVYDSSDSEPVIVSELTDFDYRNADDGPLLVLAAASVILATAVLVLVLVMAFRRRLGGVQTETQEAVDAQPPNEAGQTVVGPPPDDEV